MKAPARIIITLILILLIAGGVYYFLQRKNQTPLTPKEAEEALDREIEELKQELSQKETIEISKSSVKTLKEEQELLGSGTTIRDVYTSGNIQENKIEKAIQSGKLLSEEEIQKNRLSEADMPPPPPAQQNTVKKPVLSEEDKKALEYMEQDTEPKAPVKIIPQKKVSSQDNRRMSQEEIERELFGKSSSNDLKKFIEENKAQKKVKIKKSQSQKKSKINPQAKSQEKKS